MSKEQVQEILSHVDMTKIDLTSFVISEKKFNELAKVYHNMLILSCATIITNGKEKHGDDTVKAAYENLQGIAENPNVHDYSTVYAYVNQQCEKRLNDYFPNRNRATSEAKSKAIQKYLKETYKTMRETVESMSKNGNNFDQVFDEELITVIMKPFNEHIADDSDMNSEVNADNQNIIETVEDELVVVNSPAEESNETAKGVDSKSATTPTKKPFWRRLLKW